jgi:hypothetical protein
LAGHGTHGHHQIIGRRHVADRAEETDGGIEARAQRQRAHVTVLENDVGEMPASLVEHARIEVDAGNVVPAAEGPEMAARAAGESSRLRAPRRRAWMRSWTSDASRA